MGSHLRVGNIILNIIMSHIVVILIIVIIVVCSIETIVVVVMIVVGDMWGIEAIIINCWDCWDNRCCHHTGGMVCGVLIGVVVEAVC